MGSKPLRRSEAFWVSAIIGAYAGVVLQGLLRVSTPIPLSELWTVPVIVLGYGTLAIPVVAAGLAVFGLPATALLRRHAEAWWVGGVAILWGGVAGRLMFHAIDHALFSGNARLLRPWPPDPGILHGVPAAVAWWLLCRRVLRRQG